jgi:Protein of unknown function (DUF3866)
MLKLRRGTVVEVEPLTVEVDGERRRAWADQGLVGEMAVGDEVVVNVEAVDLGLGSGGFDVVHVNLTRGLQGEGGGGEHVMKLNYTSLQHAVEPVEAPDELPARTVPVLVIPLHGHLAPAAWAAAQAQPGIRVGYVQTPGGALPGSLSRDVALLRGQGLLAGHITAGPVHGGEDEAITVVGALDAAARSLAWDAVIAGPGPGMLGSATRYGHGGIAALDTAHSALALGLPTLASPRLSSSDPRPRHRGLSHHTQALLELLLATVRVPVPEAELEGWPMLDAEAPEGASAQAALESLIALCADHHDIAVMRVDLDGYAASGLPATTMGRSITEDPLFFAAPLASGRALAEAAGGSA